MLSSKQFYVKYGSKSPLLTNKNVAKKSNDKKNYADPLRSTADNYYNRRVQTQADQNFTSDHSHLKRLGYATDYKSPTTLKQTQSNKIFRKYGTIYGQHKEKKNNPQGFIIQSPKTNPLIFDKNSKSGTLSQEKLLRRTFGKNLQTQANYKVTSADKFNRIQNKQTFSKLLISKNKDAKVQRSKHSKSKQQKGLLFGNFESKNRLTSGSSENKTKGLSNYNSQFKNNFNLQGIKSSKDTKKQYQMLNTICNMKKVEKKTRNHLKTQPSEETTYKPDIQIIQKVGEGTFGEVYKALYENRIVAIKKVFQDKKYKNREIQILNIIKNDFVLNVIDTYYTQQKHKGQIKQYLNVVMQFYELNLFEAYNQKNPLSEIEIKLYMYQLFRGLMYIHSLDICHRDIKPQNLLVNRKNYRLVICDFGSAKKLIKGQQNIAYICSRCYRAPELIFDCANYTSMIDIWSAGCVLLQLLTSQPFFLGDSNVGQLVQIIKILGTPSKTQVINMNPDYDLDQYKFPKVKTKTWKQLFPSIDPILQSFLKQLMIYSPKQRMNAAEALAHQYFDDLREQDIYNQFVQNKQIVPLFDFTKQQLKGNQHLTNKLVPKWFSKKSETNSHK